MKKKAFYLILFVIIIITLTSCGSVNESTSYNDLVGPWQLDAKYIDGIAQDITWNILDFKSDKTVDIYEYLDEKSNSVFRGETTVPDMSEFTFKENSSVEVSKDTITFNKGEKTINANFIVDLNSYTMHLYINNDDGKIIHEVYKTADKSKRP
jgi:hypothetical protein